MDRYIRSVLSQTVAIEVVSIVKVNEWKHRDAPFLSARRILRLEGFASIINSLNLVSHCHSWVWNVPVPILPPHITSEAATY